MKVMNGPHKYVFSQFERNFLRAHFHLLCNRELAEMLGHKLTLVRTMCYEMGMKRIDLEYWTDEQVMFLKKNYQVMGDSELAEIFELKWKKEKGWSKKHIEKKRRYLNLKRTDKEKDDIRQRNIEMGRFAMCPVRAWETRGGAAPVGETRVWKMTTGANVVVIRLKEGWVHYAPWLYRQIYGPVPAGCVVRIKNGDYLNIRPGNLEMITMAENGARNSRNRLPPELWELKRLSNQLTKAIYDRSDTKKAAKHAEQTV